MKKFLYFIVAFMLILQTGFLSGIPGAEGRHRNTNTRTNTGTNAASPEPTARQAE